MSGPARTCDSGNVGGRPRGPQLGLSVSDLWIAYFSVGGPVYIGQLAAYLASDGNHLDPLDHDYLIAALNDAFVDRGLHRPLDYGPT